MLETIFKVVKWPVDEQEAIRIEKRRQCQQYLLSQQLNQSVQSDS